MLTDAQETSIFFKTLSKEETAFLQKLFYKKYYEPGEIILLQGHPVHELFIILSGTVSVSVVLPGGEEKTLSVLDKTQIVGEVAYISNTLSTATVKSVDNSECLVSPHKVLNAIRILEPEIFFKIETEIMRLISSKLIENMYNIFDFYTAYIGKKNNRGLEARIMKNRPALSLGWNAEISRNILKFNVFKELTEEEFSCVPALFTVVEYDKGILFRSQKSNKIIIIYSGAVLYLMHHLYLKQSLAVLTAGDIILQGKTLLKELNHLVDFMTYDKTITLELDLDSYNKLRELHSPVFYSINRYINKMLASSVYITNRHLIRLNCEHSEAGNKYV